MVMVITYRLASLIFSDSVNSAMLRVVMNYLSVPGKRILRARKPMSLSLAELIPCSGGSLPFVDAATHNGWRINDRQLQNHKQQLCTAFEIYCAADFKLASLRPCL